MELVGLKYDVFMTFLEAIRICLTQKYCTFKGCASRSEYFFFWLFANLLLWGGEALLFLMCIALDLSGDVGVWLSAIYWILVFCGLLLPMLGVTVRRFHDAGMSGLLLLLYMSSMIFPGTGEFVVTCFMFSVPKYKDNEYRRTNPYKVVVLPEKLLNRRPLSYWDAVYNCMVKIFDVRGKSTLGELWMFVVFEYMVVALMAFALYLSWAFKMGFDSVIKTFIMIIIGVMVIPTTTGAIRRLRDAGRSVWYILLGLVPVVGTVPLICLLMGPSKDDSAECYFGDLDGSAQG